MKRAVVLLGILALSTACGGETARPATTGFARMEALGLRDVETHSTLQAEVVTLQSTAAFAGSIEQMVAACREDLRADGITAPSESESGTPEHRIVDLNGSSDHSQMVCRVEGPRGGTGGTVALMSARAATGGPTPRAGGGFACGPLRCTESEFCQHVYGQGQPGPAPADGFACLPAAAACVGVARCACMDERRACHEIDGYPFVEVPRP